MTHSGESGDHAWHHPAHDGWYGGFQTENWTDRKRGLTIDVFTNRAGGKTAAAPLWRDVAAAYLR